MGLATTDPPLYLDLFEGCLIAFVGNQNIEKRALFNQLIEFSPSLPAPENSMIRALGTHLYQQEDYLFIDLPESHSLTTFSTHELIGNFICFKKPDVIVVICNIACLQSDLHLVLQATEITSNVIVWIPPFENTLSKKYRIDIKKLAKQLNLPVMTFPSNEKNGIEELLHVIASIFHQELIIQPLMIQYSLLVENAILFLEPLIQARTKGAINSRWVALRLIDDPLSIKQDLIQFLGFNLLEDEHIQYTLYHIQQSFDLAQLNDHRLKDVLFMSISKHAEKIAASVILLKNEKDPASVEL